MRKKLMLLSALTASLALALAFGEAPAGQAGAKTADGKKAVQEEAMVAGGAAAPCGKMGAPEGQGARCLRKKGANAAKAGASKDADCPRSAAADCPPDCDRSDCLRKSEKAESGAESGEKAAVPSETEI